MDRKKRNYPWQRWRRRVIAGCLLVFVALPVLFAFLTWRSDAKLEREAQAIRAKGFPASPDDFKKSYAAPPGGKNAAETYQQSFNAQHPTLARVQYDDMMKTYKASPNRGPLPESLHRQMEEYLAANAEALRLLHEAAKNPVSRYPLDFSQGFNMDLSHLSKLRESARLLQVEALLAASDGDTQRALEAVLAALAVGNSVREEPLIISQLVRNACHGITFDAVDRMLSGTSFSEAELAAFADALRAEADPGALTCALAGERAIALGAFDHPEQVFSQIPAVQGFGPAAVTAVAGLFRVTGMAGSDRERYLSFMEGMITASQRPIYEALPIMYAEGQRLEAGRSWLPSLTYEIAPAYGRLGEAFARDEASLASAQTVVAIERYRLANGGAVPGQLQDLVPSYLPAVPVDPFDGNPLRYRLDDTGYTVYSVNINLRDDGGQVSANDNQHQQPDLVVRVDHATASN